jgi:hypothetical protein
MVGYALFVYFISCSMFNIQYWRWCLLLLLHGTSYSLSQTLFFHLQQTPVDRAVMSGESPFEFRIRTEPLASAELNNSCNKDWRDIITPPKSHGKVSSARR